MRMEEEYKFDYDAAAEYWAKKDAKAVAMEPKALKDKIKAFIERHNTCALATASDDLVRCTPIEYNYVDGCFYLFSEGGLKFKGLKVNKHVGLAIYETYAGFGKLKSLQVTGTADMVKPSQRRISEAVGLQEDSRGSYQETPAAYEPDQGHSGSL